MVNPGDIVVADAAGVVIVPQDDAEEVLARLRAFEGKNERVLRRHPEGRLLQRSGSTTPSTSAAASSRRRRAALTVDVDLRRLLRTASLYYKIRRRLYHRTAPKQQVVARRTGFYREVWDEAAASWAGSVTRAGAGALLEIRCGDVVLRTRTNLTSLDDQLTVARRRRQASRRTGCWPRAACRCRDISSARPDDLAARVGLRALAGPARAS